MSESDKQRSKIYDDYMSAQDTAMWEIEADPRLRSTILSVWVLDSMPDFSNLRAMLNTVTERIPRFRQKVVQDPNKTAPPRWQDDPDFDPDFHVRKLHLGGAGTLRDLLDLAQPIAMQAFDKDRPLWEYYVVDGMEHGHAGIIMKLHHAISDGVGLVKMTGALMAKSREESLELPEGADASPPERAPGKTPQDLSRDAFWHRLEQREELAWSWLERSTNLTRDLITNPRSVVERTREIVGSTARMLKPVTEPASPLMRERSTRVRLTAFHVPLEDMKHTARAMGGSLNDVFVTGVTGGLHKYHVHHGKPAEALNMTMPINIRKDDDSGRKAGNQFAPARFLIPVAIEDHQERLNQLQRLVREARAEPAMEHTGAIMGLMNAIPGNLTERMAQGMALAMDICTSNVPGPNVEIYTSGARMLHQYPFGPRAGTAINLTLFSYNGYCHIGVNSDPAAVQDAELLDRYLRETFDELTDLGAAVG